MKPWQKRINLGAGIGPEWDPNGVPCCVEMEGEDAKNCEHFDGKRCDILGHAPYSACIVAVEHMAKLINQKG